jgi:hypothetical protein
VSAVALEDSRAALELTLRRLWLAVSELVLTTNEDQPEQSDLASAEHVAEVALEIQGRVAEALEVLARVGAAGRGIGDVERLLREAALLYWRDLRAYAPVSQLRGSTRRRGGAWPSWWSGVEQSLDRCEEPLVVAGRAVGDAWHELVTPPPTGTTRPDICRRSS